MDTLASLNDAHRRLRETLTNLHQAQATSRQSGSVTYIHQAIIDIERVKWVIEDTRQTLSKIEHAGHPSSTDDKEAD